MKRLILLSIVMLLSLPVMAQSLDETYTFDLTGTQINYPSGLDAELSDELLVLSNDNQQAIVIDYPFVNFLLLNTDEPSLEFLVQTIAEQVVEDEIDAEAIYAFDVDGRAVAAYDLEGLQVAGTVYAIEFSNGGIGMLITFNLRERVDDAMLESFDSFDAVIEDAAVSAITVEEEPYVYLFRSDGRFVAPANWSVEARLNVNLEYVVVISPDDDAEVILFDLSQMVKSRTDLKDVVEVSGVDWFNDFDVRFGDDEPQPYDIGEREAISFDIEIRNIRGSFDGQFIVMRFTSDAIVAAIMYGETDAYTRDIKQILGSFNNIGATLDYMN